MSAPWSAFPVALTITNADILACVQMGINKQYFRPKLLTAVGGDPIALASGTGLLGYDGSGNLIAQMNPGTSFSLTDGTNDFLFVSPSGKTTVAYTPVAPGDWVTPPTNLGEAIDKLANVVSSGGSIPIPDLPAGNTTCATATVVALGVPIVVPSPVVGQLWWVIPGIAHGTPYTIHNTATVFASLIGSQGGSCGAPTVDIPLGTIGGSVSALATGPAIWIELDTVGAQTSLTITVTSP
jgi:hypothetical protein